MSVSPEIAWIIPIAIPFILGFLIGSIIKRTVKLILGILAVIAFLIATGYIKLASGSIFDKVMKVLPKIMELGSGTASVLPYSATAFIIGLILGFLKR